MVKKRVKYVFVILVYRNATDVQNFINSLQKFYIDKEIIIVNSYYDDKSMETSRIIAENNNCRFLNIENRGYGYGNNRGIEYANKHFDYDFLIISNPDVILKKFDDSELFKFNGSVVGPIIRTIKGKSQNPYWVFHNRVSEWLIYQGYNHENKVVLYSGIAINKILREIFLYIFQICKKKYRKVFALHGCFIVLPHSVLKNVGLPYDEEMFLFAEEAHLAHMLFANKIDSYITKDIEVLHKEDGSMAISDINEKSESRKSVLIYYKKWHKKNLTGK